MNVPQLRTPVFVNLDLTTSCNQKCIFCAVSPDTNYSFKSEEHFKGLIDKLFSEGVFEITLFGGEPLLHPKVKDIAKYIHGVGMEVNIVTNGMLYGKIPQLARYLENASVSIHGFREVHESLTQVPGSFSRSLKGVEKFIENGIRTSICYTLVKTNYPEIGSFVEYMLSNYDITSVVVDRFIPRGFGEAVKDKLDVTVQEINEALRSMHVLSRKYKKGVTTGDGLPLCKIDEDLKYIVQPCQAGVLFCSVTEDGDVKICPSASTKMGNINSNSLEDIWNSKTFRNMRSFNWIPEYCKECKILSNCYSGCKVSSGIEPYGHDILLRV